MCFITLLTVLIVLGSDTFTEPSYPPHAVAGGTVVAHLRAVPGGAAQVDIVSGEEPFVSSCKAALQNWNLPSEKHGANLVVVHFRPPNIYYMGYEGERVRCSDADKSLPCPVYVVGPAYPAQSSAQGMVILRLEIGDDGQIQSVRTIKGMGVFTEASADAVRKWRFTPSIDERGVKKASSAYAVFVYRFPVIQLKE